MSLLLSTENIHLSGYVLCFSIYTVVDSLSWCDLKKKPSMSKSNLGESQGFTPLLSLNKFLALEEIKAENTLLAGSFTG